MSQYSRTPSARQIRKGKGAGAVQRERKEHPADSRSPDLAFHKVMSSNLTKKGSAVSLEGEYLATTIALNTTTVPKLEAGMTPLQSGKLKLRRAADNMVSAAAMEATEYLGLVNCQSPMQGQVMDLRAVPSSLTHMDQFQSCGIHSFDFAAERSKHKFHAHGKAPDLGKKVPETPDAKIYMLLDDPDSSIGANIWSIFMGVCIIASVACIFVKALISVESDDVDNENPDTATQTWKVLECFFTIVFLSEYILRFAVCEATGSQTYVEFLLRPLNLCDICAVMPFFIEILIRDANFSEARLLRIARLLRLARVARLARLTRGKSSKTRIFGPIAAVFTIIWGIYLKYLTG